MNVLNQPSPLDARWRRSTRNGVSMRVNVADGRTAVRRVFGGMAGLQLVDLRGAAQRGLRLAQRDDEVEGADKDRWVRTRMRGRTMPVRVA